MEGLNARQEITHASNSWERQILYLLCNFDTDQVGFPRWHYWSCSEFLRISCWFLADYYRTWNSRTMLLELTRIYADFLKKFLSLLILGLDTWCWYVARNVQNDERTCEETYLSFTDSPFPCSRKDYRGPTLSFVLIYRMHSTVMASAALHWKRRHRHHHRNSHWRQPH